MPEFSIQEFAERLVDAAIDRGQRITFEEAIACASALQMLRQQNVKVIRGKLAMLTPHQRELVRTVVVTRARATGISNQPLLWELHRLRAKSGEPAAIERQTKSPLDKHLLSERTWIEVFGW